MEGPPTFLKESLRKWRPPTFLKDSLRKWGAPTFLKDSLGKPSEFKVVTLVTTGGAIANLEKIQKIRVGHAGYPKMLNVDIQEHQFSTCFIRLFDMAGCHVVHSDKPNAFQ